MKREKNTTSKSKAKMYQLGTIFWEYFFIILLSHNSFAVKRFILLWIAIAITKLTVLNQYATVCYVFFV